MIRGPHDRSRRRALAIGVAVTVDGVLGDLPTVIHPVGLVGRAARFLESRAPDSAAARLRYGIVAPGLVLGASAAAGFVAERLARRTPWPVAAVLEGGALSTLIALRGLLARAEEVRAALVANDLDGARAILGRHLVSRDTSPLEADEVAGAAIESVAENLSDGVIAPLLAYAVAGLPGALVYRGANTFDSLWGYRTDRYRELGRHAARLDDALNLVPSRASAGALVAAAALSGLDARRALDVWLDEGDFTPSPNAGQTMGAMAGALGVALEKDGAYHLGHDGRQPEPGDIERAVDLARMAALLAAGALAAGLVLLARLKEQG
ncbi:MAG: adenosylcobinamide-phosphate synthase CbiB [Dehalococcoidia bacterium]